MPAVLHTCAIARRPAILAHGRWQHDSEMMQWELLKGDFRDFIDTAASPT
jgi:hypothetical protein